MQIKGINFCSFNKYPINLLDNTVILKQQRNTVSFSSTGQDGNKMRRLFNGIHCPCCGIKMLSPREVFKVTTALEKLPAQKVIKTLQTYEPRLHDVEKEMLFLLNDLSKEYPKYTIRELLNTKRIDSLQELYRSEINILDRIKAVAAFCHNDKIDKIDEILTEAENLLSDKTIDSTFKRRAFIAKMWDAIYNMEEKDIAKTIINISKQLPRAGTDKNAFIVKYTEKNPITHEERTSGDIIRAILAPSVATIEHVKAKSPNAKNGGGVNQMRNYLLECARDNNMRSDMLFSDFVKQNPQFFGQHAQNYIDEIILQINHGRLKGFEQYPVQIARTLRRQSRGKINLDVSKLDPDKYYKAKECGKNSPIE